MVVGCFLWPNPLSTILDLDPMPFTWAVIVLAEIAAVFGSPGIICALTGR